MFIKPRKRKSAGGFTLVETLIACGLSSIVVTGAMMSFLGCGRSLVSLSNYTSLNQNAQNAIDRMSREVRSVACLTNYTTIAFNNSSFPSYRTITNSVTFIPAGGSLTNTNSWITYGFNSQSGAFTRTQSGTNQTLLTNCSFLNFQMFQRNQSNGTFVPIPTSSAAQTKLIQVNWLCASSYNPMLPTDTASLESAKIVIRSK